MARSRLLVANKRFWLLCLILTSPLCFSTHICYGGLYSAGCFTTQSTPCESGATSSKLAAVLVLFYVLLPLAAVVFHHQPERDGRSSIAAKYINQWMHLSNKHIPMVGGGRESTKLRLKKAVPPKDKVFSFHPFEVVSYSECQTTVTSDSIRTIPFESQCRSALSTLLQKAEKTPSQYHYIKFPFGLMDTSGLKDLLASYDHRTALKRTLEEKKWLNKQFRVPHPDMCISESNTASFFSSIWEGNCDSGTTDQITCARNLVGTRWLSDVSVLYMANLINSKTSTALCLVAQHPTVMFTQDLLVKLERVRLGQDIVQDILVILNVGKEKNGDTRIAFEGGNGGCHWTLLFFHVNSPLWYYGDSLGWQFPSNIDRLVSLLQQIQTMSGLTVMCPNIRCELLHDPSSRDIHHTHTCRDKCKLFYPIQTCSNVCGAVSVLMAALLSQNKTSWPNSKAIPQRILLVQNATTYSDYLRRILIHWTINKQIDVQMFYDSFAKSTTPAQEGSVKDFYNHSQKTCKQNASPTENAENYTPTENTTIHEDRTPAEKTIGNEGSSHYTCSCSDSENDSARNSGNDLDFEAAENHTPTDNTTTDKDCTSDESTRNHEGSSHNTFSCSDCENDPAIDSGSDSDFETWKGSSIIQLLPSEYEYKNWYCRRVDTSGSFEAEFKINIQSDREVKEWVKEYNTKTKQTMVFGRKKSLKGKHASTKYFLHCHHKQRQTGKHQKSTKILKTVVREHSIKHTNCPAKMNISVLPSTTCGSFGVAVTLFYKHNHPINAADALRFRPISEDVQTKYFNLFRLGHTAATAHLEYETNFMLSQETPCALADRSLNPKRKDVYNLFSKWRKENLGVKDGREMYEQLEQIVRGYNDQYSRDGGQAVIKRYTKHPDGSEDPLILALCTPLMSRAHTLVRQASEVVYIDSSSSLDDYNNAVFVLSTSSAAGGLPLGVVVTSGESTVTIEKAMSTLKEILPESGFGQRGRDIGPQTIITDDSNAEREGLKLTWPQAELFLCIFHVLQSVWRWLCDSKHSIDKQHRQTLMNLFRKLVYAHSPQDLEYEYKFFKGHPLVINYKQFSKYIEVFWARKAEWSIAYRACYIMRGNHTNNYSETGIRILKDIVFKRIKAYNLIQVFEFLTVTFETYYQARLLAVAHNRLDRYIALRFKGLGTEKINDVDVKPSSDGKGLYIVKSQLHPEVEYVVDVDNGMCTCSLGWNGQPTGEPCRHQAAVARKYKMNGLNMIPTFNVDGRFLFAQIAVGKDAGPLSFYSGLHDGEPDVRINTQNSTSNNDEQSSIESDKLSQTDYDEGAANLDLLIDEIDRMENITDQATTLHEKFSTDVKSRLHNKDTNYALGLTKFITKYFEIIEKTEPTVSATPKLATFLHTTHTRIPPPQGGTRKISVQPTGIQRRRKGITRGSQKAPQGRPLKRKMNDSDLPDNFQPKRGKPEHTKKKRNLKLNEQLNQPNYFKH